MRYKAIDNSLYKHNRNNFKKHLKPKSVAVFNSNDILPINADGVLPLYQNADLLYTCGVDQEETILLIAPDATNPKHREVLFVKETSELIAIWDGAKLTKEEAAKHSGVETVYWTSQFDQIFHALVMESENIYLNQNEHLRANTTVQTRDDRFRISCKEKYPLHNYERIAPIMRVLRPIKHQLEVDTIQHACNITEKGFRRVLNFIKPGVMEYEIEAEFAYEFLRSGSRGFAYTPIIGSGYNACVLHYLENHDECKDGDVILMDVGAEYANYMSDMTRSVPVNGKFTTRQKDVYNAVLRVLKACVPMLTPGTDHMEYHDEVGKMMESELIGLGLLDKHDVAKQDKSNPLYKKYFMHGTSHHMGLDVHDVEDRSTPFAPGMVLTVEPGIYIREENLGIRLENDILITEEGQLDLMKNIPIEADEIEDLMNS